LCRLEKPHNLKRSKSMARSKPEGGASKAKGMNDDPTQAIESGEPKLTGRSRGEVIDDQGTGAGKETLAGKNSSQPGHNDNTSGQSGKTSQAPASGRQRATP
jgi:hypothetical protein